GGGVHGDGGTVRSWARRPAPPCHKARDIIPRNLGQCLVLAKELNQPAQFPPRVARAAVMLANLVPIATSDIVEGHRRARSLGLRDVLLRLLALGALYRFGFAPGRGLG